VGRSLEVLMHNGTDRTIRVPGTFGRHLNTEVASERWPDNDRSHALPPDMGPFKLL
jgi:hypothetical protein